MVSKLPLSLSKFTSFDSATTHTKIFKTIKKQIIVLLYYNYIFFQLYRNKYIMSSHIFIYIDELPKNVFLFMLDFLMTFSMNLSQAFI